MSWTILYNLIHRKTQLESRKELRDIIGCDPVAHLDKEHAKEQILDILAHIEDYQKFA